MVAKLQGLLKERKSKPVDLESLKCWMPLRRAMPVRRMPLGSSKFASNADMLAQIERGAHSAPAVSSISPLPVFPQHLVITALRKSNQSGQILGSVKFDRIPCVKATPTWLSRVAIALSSLLVRMISICAVAGTIKDDVSGCGTDRRQNQRRDGRINDRSTGRQ